MKKLVIATACALPFASLPLCAGQANAQTVSVEVDTFELQAGQGNDSLVFDSALSVGGERHAIVLKAEGENEKVHLNVEEVEGQVLYAFMPTDGTTLMAGVRHDFRPGKDLTYATLAVEQGLGSLIEGEHFLFVSQDGDVTGSGQVIVALPVGLATTLEPRASVGWSAQRIVQEDIGSGITDVELSARLRQAIGPVFDVYVGAVHERLVGNTRDIARENGDAVSVTRAVIGAGFSF